MGDRQELDAIEYELDTIGDKLDKVLFALTDMYDRQHIPALYEAMNSTSQAITLLNSVYDKINEAKLKVYSI